MDFTKSDALFPAAELRQALGVEYERQCRQLCFGQYPTWGAVLERFEELRELLLR
jgi:hypothetical protein